MFVPGIKIWQQAVPLRAVPWAQNFFSLSHVSDCWHAMVPKFCSQPQGDSVGSQVFGKWLGLEDRVHVPGDWHFYKRGSGQLPVPFHRMSMCWEDEIGGRSAQPTQQICQSLNSGLSRCLSYDKQNRTKPTKQKTPTLCIASIKWGNGIKDRTYCFEMRYHYL